MLKNEKLVHRLTLEEKLNLIISFDKNKTGEVENYNFPVFDLVNNPVDLEHKAKCTNFPGIKGLSMTFNESLIEGISQAQSIEKNIFSENPFFVFDNRLDINYLSDDAYFNGRILASYFKGIKDSYSSLIYRKENLSKDDTLNREISSLTDYYVLKDNSTDYMIVDSIATLDETNYFYQGSDRYISCTVSLTELIKFINLGIYQNQYLGDKAEAIDYLTKATKRYEFFYSRLKNGLISKADYEKEFESGSMLDLNKLDECADNYISLLLALEKDRKKSVAENSFLKEGNTYSFDASHHYELAYGAAAESVVLLKNRNHVLPIKLNKKIAVVGDAFKNPEYYNNEFQHDSLLYKYPNDLIKDYLELDCLGFAHGYLKDKPIEFECLENAKKLIDDADVMLYYMEADSKTHEIPDEQVQVLRELKAHKNIPTVVVLNTKTHVEISFLDLVEGLILSMDAGEAGPRAVLDIVSGALNPSGRLSAAYPMLPGEDNQESCFPSYSTDDVPQLFPFGYGLSYSSFEYSHFVVNENGVSFTVKNTSDVDGYIIPQVYVKQINTKHSLRQMTLKGFKKILIKSRDTEKVFIDFDESAFRYYDKQSHSFGIEGGEYRVYIGNDSHDIIYKATLKISKYLNRGFLASDKETISTLDTKHGLEEIDNVAGKFHYGRKKLVATLVFIYLFILVGICFIEFILPILGDLDEIPRYIALGASALLEGLDILFYILYLVKTRKKYKAILKEFEDSELSLSEMIDNVPDFDVTNKVDYVIHTKKELKEIEEQQELPQTEFEKKVEEIIIEETKKEEEEQEPQEEKFQEIDLEVEKEEEVEEVVDLESAGLSAEEIAKHEEEERNRINAIEENIFEDYEEVIHYDNNQSISQVADKLIAFARSHGLILEVTSARSIISSIASSNIIFLYSKQKELLPKLSQVVTMFFQSKGHEFKERKHFQSAFDLAWEKDQNGQYQKTVFVNDIYNASRFKDSINIETLTNVTMAKFPIYFKDFIDFSESPTRNHYLRINDKQSLKIPTNITFIVIPKYDDFMCDMDSKLSYVSNSVFVTVREADTEEITNESIDPISYPYFKELINEAKKDFYIKEENWKKFDELEETIKKQEKFRIDNKLVLSLESYSSIYLDLGGEEVDAIDSILAEKFVPILKSLKLAKQEDFTKYMSEQLEKLFGEDSVVKAKKTLKRFDRVLNTELEDSHAGESEKVQEENSSEGDTTKEAPVENAETQEVASEVQETTTENKEEVQETVEDNNDTNEEEQHE